jgi:hypothetical protein
MAQSATSSSSCPLWPSISREGLWVQAEATVPPPPSGVTTSSGCYGKKQLSPSLWRSSLPVYFSTDTVFCTSVSNTLLKAVSQLHAAVCYSLRHPSDESNLSHSPSPGACFLLNAPVVAPVLHASVLVFNSLLSEFFVGQLHLKYSCSLCSVPRHLVLILYLELLVNLVMKSVFSVSLFDMRNLVFLVSELEWFLSHGWWSVMIQ